METVRPDALHCMCCGSLLHCKYCESWQALPDNGQTKALIKKLEAEKTYLRTVIKNIGQFLDRNDDAGLQLARQAVADLDRPDDT